MKKRIVWLLVSCVMAVAMLLTACGPAATTTPPTTTPPTVTPTATPTATPTPTVTPTGGPQYGGTLVLGSVQILKSLDVEAAGTDILYVDSYVYEKLGVGNWAKGPAGTNEWSWFHYTYSPIQYLKGALAESWEQPDPMTVIFHLRKGVRFHNKPPVNGREVVADDVVYSYTRAKNNPKATVYVLPYIASITATDKYTVVFKATQLHCEFLQQLLVGCLIWPKEMFDTYGGTISQVKAISGTGPFIADDFVTESSITFKKNPDYWAYDEVHPENRLPYVNAYKFLMIYDLPTRLAALRSGKMDYIFDIAPQDGQTLLKTNPELVYKQDLSYLSAPKFNMRQDLKTEPFSDVRVRKAMSMSIDRDKIIKEYLLGKGEKNNFPIMTNWTDVYVPIADYPPEVREQWDYNPTKAKELLKDAGYPNGFQTEIVTEERYRERVELVAAYFEAIGVKPAIKVVDRATWVSMAWGYGTKTYPHMIAGGAGAVSPLDSCVNKLTNAYYNTEMYANPAFDAKFNEILGTLDIAKRTQLYKDIQQLYFKDVSCITFPGEYVYHLWEPWVGGYHGEKCLGSMNFGGIAARMWIDQAAKKAAGR